MFIIKVLSSKSTMTFIKDFNHINFDSVRICEPFRKYLYFDKLSLRQRATIKSVCRNVRSSNDVCSTNCPSAKCLSAKCLSAKCPSAKCPLVKCLSAKCQLQSNPFAFI